MVGATKKRLFFRCSKPDLQLRILSLRRQCPDLHRSSGGYHRSFLLLYFTVVVVNVNAWFSSFFFVPTTLNHFHNSWQVSNFQRPLVMKKFYKSIARVILWRFWNKMDGWPLSWDTHPPVMKSTLRCYASSLLLI